MFKLFRPLARDLQSFKIMLESFVPSRECVSASSVSTFVLVILSRRLGGTQILLYSIKSLSSTKYDRVYYKFCRLIFLVRLLLVFVTWWICI